MLSLKKSFLLIGVFSTSFSYAQTKDLQDFHVDFDSDVRVAAEALVQEIRNDENENHWPIPGCGGYKPMHLVRVFGNDPETAKDLYRGTVEIDDQTKLLKSIDISNVKFEAAKVPLAGDYIAMIKLHVEFTPGCTKILSRAATDKDKTNGSRYYAVTESNYSLVNGLFAKDMTGNNYNPQDFAYADVVFESLLNTNAELRALCPNFTPHVHKSYCF